MFQGIVHSVSVETSFTNSRFPEMVGCVHVSLSATLHAAAARRRRADSSDDQLAVVFEAEDDGTSLDDGRLASLTRFGGPQALSAFHIDGENAVRCCG